MLTILPLGAMPVLSAEEDGFSYTIVGDEATLTGVSETVSGDVVIPSTLGGCRVTAIGDRAFFGGDIATVVLPDGVKSIGDHAFHECSKLSSVTIGSGKPYHFNASGVCTNP